MANYWLIPREQVLIEIPENMSPEAVLDIYEAAALQYFLSHNPGVTFRNKVSSEVGYWKKGVVGYSSKATIKNAGTSLLVIVKGTNAYYSDLPVAGTEEGKTEWVEHPVKHTLNNIIQEIESSW